MATTLNQPAHRARPPARATATPERRSEEHQRLSKFRRPGNPGQAGIPAKARTAAPQHTAVLPQRTIATRPAVSMPAVRSHLRHSAGFTIEKAFTALGFTVGTLLVLLFGGDLAVGLPLQRVSLTLDIGNLLCGIILLYLSADVLRDQRRMGLW